MSESLWPNGLQHTRLLCPPLSPRVCSNSRPLSQWQRRKWQPTPIFLLGESHGQRSLAGHGPWGHRVGQDWSDWARKSVMLSNHLILCRPLLILPSIFPSIRVFPMSWLFTSHGQSIGASANQIDLWKKNLSNKKYFKLIQLILLVGKVISQWALS